MLKENESEEKMREDHPTSQKCVLCFWDTEDDAPCFMCENNQFDEITTGKNYFRSKQVER